MIRAEKSAALDEVAYVMNWANQNGVKWYWPSKTNSMVILETVHKRKAAAITTAIGILLSVNFYWD